MQSGWNLYTQPPTASRSEVITLTLITLTLITLTLITLTLFTLTLISNEHIVDCSMEGDHRFELLHQLHEILQGTTTPRGEPLLVSSSLTNLKSPIIEVKWSYTKLFKLNHRSGTSPATIVRISERLLTVFSTVMRLIIVTVFALLRKVNR
ncbi:hypothetical protein PROFUN_09241 [Planoprotostelium fungivorum]|uniref:Uncharacterized protein n=1 Tax=Planoprotostelium fungivorum TaxID=1890364 RepID=A0A2P6NKV3_9EUKA|nr:hypothetical protein PROFUN_09241 [Planoprotostelium fungivorum]